MKNNFEKYLNASQSTGLVQVMEFITKEYGVSEELMYSSTRYNIFTYPRFCIWFLMHDVYAVNYSIIGKLFERDHTTVRAGIIKVKENGRSTELIHKFMAFKALTKPQI